MVHDNDHVCVLIISSGDQHILLTADIEQSSEQTLLKNHADKLAATLVVAPHHGSKTSSSLPFVDSLSPA